ncbi:hypothetical protein H072_3323 [Dactylellina haptotyla CBS 200.50]|uniref:RING-type domain-containing protein n=1 Tax=Dactylellina haptotyla (strain CBS 200.50) TaxID=1284197 RepID=S8AIL3_DACHA|nr:hypothetical protein H072_3323 [Dactylellina haptotyla CBS 200.50]
MDFSAPTRPIQSTSSLFSSSAAVKPPTTSPTNTNGHLVLPQQTVASSSSLTSASTSLKRASTEPADGLNASASMPALRSRSNKVAKNSQNGGEPASLSNQVNGDLKAASPPAPLYDPRDDQIKDLQSDLSKLQKCVTCVVCQDLLFEPYSLGCGHVFCYSCLKDWFKQKKTCPECRARVKHQPAPAYLIRGMIDTFVIRAELQSPHDEGQTLRSQQQEALKMVEADKNDPKGLFTGMFAKKANGGNALYDPEDGVARCPDCTWEIEDRRCPNCGRRFHASEMPGNDSDISDASDFSEESDLDEEDDDDSISISDRSENPLDADMHDMDDYPDSENGPWEEPDYDEDHRLALALQDQYHQEFMRHLGVPPNFLEEQFGVDRALAARAAAQRSMLRATFSSPGRSIRHSSPFSRTSEEDSEENTLEEDDSDLDDFIVHDTPERRQRRHHPTARTLRRHARRSVADLSDEEDEEDEDEEEDEELVASRLENVSRRAGRTNRYYNQSTIIISSDNEDDEEAAGLINDGYSQLDHDTTTGDEHDDEDSLDESDIGQMLRPAGPLRASTMPATTSAGARSRNPREPVFPDRSSTPPRRRRRTVTFQVPEDADGENDSDARDDDGDLDMDRHSRAGSTSLASITSNRTDASTRANRSGGNHFSQDTPSVNEDESSDDSLPRQRPNRRRIGNTTSSSNLRRAATAHPTGSRNRLNRPANPTVGVDPVVHRLLRTFNAQRNESQLEQLGMSVEGGTSVLPAPRSASHDLQELNEPILITSSPARNPFPTDNGHRQSPITAVSSTHGRAVGSLGSPSPAYPVASPGSSRAQSVLSSPESTPGPGIISAPVQQMTANISTVVSEPSAWEISAVSPSVTSSTAATVATSQNGSTNRGSMRTRRSNAALRAQDIQRTGTPTNRMAARSGRAQPQTTTNREEIQRRARDLVAGRTRDLTSAGSNGQASTTTTTSNTARTRSANHASAAMMSLQQRINQQRILAANHRAEASANGRDSVTPTPTTQTQEATITTAPTHSLTRNSIASASGRRRGYPLINGNAVNNPGPGGPLFVISDEDN